MMEESFEEFKNNILNSSHTKNHKIKDSIGVYDIYKHIRKNHWYNIGRPLKEKEFYAVVRGVNKLLADNLAHGKTVKFPFKMGVLELRKHKAGVFFTEEGLKVTYPPDWSETLKLWYEDEEARKKKTLLRIENPWVYSVKYLRFPANYANKHFYQFKVNTFIKRALKENIKQGKTDTLW